MLPDGYTARPARLDDAGSVATLIASNQLADFGVVEVSEADVRDDWAGVDMTADTLVIERAGAVRALVDLVVRPGLVSAYGYVHPDDVGRGLGSYLADWAEGRAASEAIASAASQAGTGTVAGGDTVVRHYVPSSNSRAVTLLEDRGYGFQRAVLWMERDLHASDAGAATGAGGAAARVLPPGLRLRTYRGDSDEPAVYQAFEAGSLDMNGRVPNTLEQWLATARTKDRGLFFLVETGTGAGSAPAGPGEDDGSIVGILIASLRQPDGVERSVATPAGNEPQPAAAAIGHVDSLRVVRAWRRRGIGAALLATAFAALSAGGATSVGLSVDAASPTGAPALYLNAGMRVTRRYLVMERRFGDPG